jgi:hypothetical protein
VKNKHLVLTPGAFITGTLILLFSCRKINEATELGGGLIPPVDNITTFDTTLEVQAFNDTFTLATDSTLSLPEYEHFLGVINNDPIFGKTNAQIFLELKPPYYKYSFINKADSLHIDSVVLVLSYVETYGDTTVPQTVNVYEIGGQLSDFRYDTTYRIRENGIPRAGLLGSRTFKPEILNDSVKSYLDTTVNQLRIRLNDAFGQRLLNYDTSGTSGAYSSDTAFRTNFKGFALESVSGNALMGFNLNGAGTKLAIYYKDDNNDAPANKWDTAVAYFSFTSLAASANLVRRDYTGTPLAAAVNGTTTPDDLVYIQNTPGSFATIKIPNLAGLTNRIVHRAELIMEEIYDPSDTLFPPPPGLYLDAYDPAAAAFRTIPYDFYFDASGSSNLASFGAVPFVTTDPMGRPVKSWRFNLSRYVQNIVNGTQPAYNLRLHAPVYTYNQYRPSPTAESTKVAVSVNPAPAKGRVRLGGGNHPTQKMRLRIVYSKI